METHKKNAPESKPTPQGAEEVQYAKTASWSGSFGFRLPGTRSKPPRINARDVFTRVKDLEAVQQKAAKSTREDKVVGAQLAKGFVVKKALKGNDQKKTCLIEVDGEPLVLKGAEGTPKPHAAATEFIRGLALNGVRAPKTRALSDQEKAEVMAVLDQMKGDPDAEQLREALRKGDGQVSEMDTGGIASDKVFPNSKQKAANQKGTALREQLLGAEPNAAWQTAARELELASKGTPLKIMLDPAGKPQHELSKWMAGASAADKKAALKVLSEYDSSPMQASLLEVLADIDSGKLQEGIDRAKAEAAMAEEVKPKMKAFAKSKEGMEAYAGVVAADLITGMHDRIAKAWNGGNFLYDPTTNELVCVDNAKEPNQCLTAADPGEWKNFFNEIGGGSEPIEDVLFNRIYGKDEGCPDKPGTIVDLSDAEAAQAKGVIRNVLIGVVAKTDENAATDPVARDRVAFLKAKLALDHIFRVPAHLSNPQRPVDPEAANKVGRSLKSAFTLNKKDKRVDTDAIKKALRDGTMTAQEARDKLEKLKEASKSVSTDRRSNKINFLADAMEFRELMLTRALELKLYLSDTPPPPEMLSADVSKGVAAPMNAAYSQWKQVTEGDRKTLDLIEKAWALFPAEYRAA